MVLDVPILSHFPLDLVLYLRTQSEGDILVAVYASSDIRVSHGGG